MGHFGHGRLEVCMTCAEENASTPFWNLVARECNAKCSEGREGRTEPAAVSASASGVYFLTLRRIPAYLRRSAPDTAIR